MASGNTSSIQYLVVPRRNSSTSFPVVCFNPTTTSSGGIWQGQTILDYSFPRFVVQLLLIVLLTRFVALLLRPLHQPRYLANVIGGILMGPTGLGRIPWIAAKLFPLSSVTVLENIAYLGLIYFTFITGIEVDFAAVRRSDRSGRSAVFAFVCISIPFAIAALTASGLQPTINDDAHTSFISFIIFLGVALSITSFSVLARSLAELKLLNSKVGAMALAASMIVDSWAWALLALAITLTQSNGDLAASLWTMLSGLCFYGAAHILVRPLAAWVSARTPEGGIVDEFGAGTMLVGVMVAALIADAIGIHSVLGAFIYGLVIPNDNPVGGALIEQLEDFVDGLLLPLFFGISGLKTNLSGIDDIPAATFLVITVVASAAAKIIGCLAVANMFRIPLRDGVVIGLLMNTKGVIELVLLNIGRNQQMLSEASFTVLVCTSAMVTALVSPFLRLSLRSTHRQPSFRRRSVQTGRPESELRIVVCIHATRHVPGMLSLLDAANPTKRHPISAVALHLVELSSRPSSMFAIHNAATVKDSSISAQQPPTTTCSSASAAITHAFESYKQRVAGITVSSLTAVSPYPTMHRDISAIAEDFGTALIVIPFHKHHAVDGSMETTIPALRSLNQSILASATCSVAILIDRGLPAPSHLSAPIHAALFFLGGPDDREALAFASRIAGHPKFSLKVLRLLHSTGNEDSSVDDEFITEFRFQHVSDDSVIYEEAVATSASDTVAALRSIVDVGHNLYIVGKGSGVGTQLTAGLTDWSECPELGPIGDLLVSPDFGIPVSVLVVQQCSAIENGDSESESVPGKSTLTYSRGRLSMISANKATYRTRSLAARRK